MFCVYFLMLYLASKRKPEITLRYLTICKYVANIEEKKPVLKLAVKSRRRNDLLRKHSTRSLRKFGTTKCSLKTSWLIGRTSRKKIIFMFKALKTITFWKFQIVDHGP